MSTGRFPGTRGDRADSTRSLPSITLMGTSLSCISQRQCVKHIIGESLEGRGGWVVTPNVNILSQFRRDPEFAAMCDKAELRVADGAPLIWASRLQGTPLPQRVAGSDLVNLLASEAARHAKSVFLLGGAPGTADKAARELEKRYRNLRVAGTFCPPYGFESNAQIMAQMTDALRASRPDVVFVALGAPKQERLIMRLRHELPNAWWLGVGVSFSFISGDLRRAPRWMQQFGLEWLHRTTQEPRRLGMRYARDLPFCAGMMMRCVALRASRTLSLLRRQPGAKDAPGWRARMHGG